VGLFNSGFGGFAVGVDNGSSNLGHNVGFMNSGWIGEDVGFGNADVNAGFDVGLLNSGNGYNTGTMNAGLNLLNLAPFTGNSGFFNMGTLSSGFGNSGVGQSGFFGPDEL
jgi:hypothetical protein